MKYIKKPYIVDAIQWDGDNIEDIEEFFCNPDTNFIVTDSGALHIGIGGKTTYAIMGDYIYIDPDGLVVVTSEKRFHDTFDLCGNVF